MVSKIKIENDGRPSWDTKISVAETGEPLEQVKRVELVFDAAEKNPPTAVVYCYLPIVNVIMDAEIKHLCPYCGYEKTEKTEKTEEKDASQG